MERSGERRRGQALVEFALVMPVFLLVVFGAVEFARLLLDQHYLTTAARRATRIGTLPEKTEADVTAVVDGFLTHVGMTSDSWTTTVQVNNSSGVARAGGLGSSVPGDLVYVTVAHDFSLVTGSLLPVLQGTVTLEGKCVFRHE